MTTLREIAGWLYGDAKEADDLDSFDVAAMRLEEIADVLDELENFVRTPEWSVSMLEDIAELVRSVRDVGEDFGPDDERAWQPH